MIAFLRSLYFRARQMAACVLIVLMAFPIGIASVGCLGIGSMDFSIQIVVRTSSWRFPFFLPLRAIVFLQVRQIPLTVFIKFWIEFFMRSAPFAFARWARRGRSQNAGQKCAFLRVYAKTNFACCCADGPPVRNKELKKRKNVAERHD